VAIEQFDKFVGLQLGSLTIHYLNIDMGYAIPCPVVSHIPLDDETLQH
jgi:hypothetical protein